MKRLYLIGALITVIAFTSCTTSHYVSRPGSSSRHYGIKNNGQNRSYDNRHGNIYRGSAHGGSTYGGYSRSHHGY